MIRRSAFSVIILAVVALSAGCLSSRQPINVDEWRVNTLRLAATSEQGGAYAEAASGTLAEATPYSTYHALKTLQLLGMEPTPAQQNRTVRWLRSTVKNGLVVPRLRSGDDIGDLFYSLNILSNANSGMPDRQPIADMVHELQFEAGSYAFSQKHKRSVLTRPDVDDALLSTYEALQILQLIGEAPKRQSELVSWLQQEWDAKSTRANEVATLSMLAECLHMVSPTDSRLGSAWTIIEAHLNTQLQNPGQSREFLLMDLASVLDAAERLNVQAPLVPSDFVAELERHQNGDGGFNAFLNGDSDYLGIYLAAQLLKHAQRIEPHREQINNLITAHQLPTGGYATMSSRPVSLPATRGMVQAAGYLQVSVDASGLGEYLADVVQDGANPTDVHLALDTAQLAHIDLPVKDELKDRLVHWTDLHGMPKNPEELDRLYHSVWALHLLHVELPTERREQIASSLELMRNPDGGYGPDGKSGLDTTARIVLILQAVQAQPPDPQNLVRWIRGRQQGGFAEPDGPEELGVTYLALEALHALGSGPSTPAQLRRWIALCLKNDGGASSAPQGTEPDDGADSGALMWTGMAIRSLELTGLEPLTEDGLRDVIK